MNRSVLCFTVKPAAEAAAIALNQEFEPRQRAANARIEGLRGWDKFVLRGRYIDVIDYDGELGPILDQAGKEAAHSEFLERMHPLLQESSEHVQECFMRRISHYSADE